ncbi:MAG: twin-arginine translocase TatA/TatE family subunit [Nitrospira sp.]
MFGTMGFSELIIILVIILIIFGAGRLPQIGEGVGKALKGFRKEVHEAPQPSPREAQQEATQPRVESPTTDIATTGISSNAQSSLTAARTNTPYVPGPELTPGTTASLLYNAPQGTSQVSAAAPRPAAATSSSPVISMEERAEAPPPTARPSYPSLPATPHAKVATKRPSAIVNKDAVARVQAQQAALKAKATSSAVGMSPENMQDFGEGLGEVVRTFRQAVSDVRNSVDPQMHTIQAELGAAQKEIQQSIEAAKEQPPIQDDSTKSA